jgi:hypothetical protein
LGLLGGNGVASFFVPGGIISFYFCRQNFVLQARPRVQIQVLKSKGRTDHYTTQTIASTSSTNGQGLPQTVDN